MVYRYHGKFRSAPRVEEPLFRKRSIFLHTQWLCGVRQQTWHASPAHRFGRLAMTIQYDASRNMGICGLLYFRGTVLPSVLLSPLFWLAQLLHLGVLVLGGTIQLPGNHGFRGWELPELPWNLASLSLGLLFFFLVFCERHRDGTFCFAF